MAQGQTLKAAARLSREPEATRRVEDRSQSHEWEYVCDGYDPNCLEFGGPVGDLMYFVEQQERRATFGSGLGIRPASFPETGQRGVRIVACGIDGLIAELLCEFEQQRGLADLSRPGQDLDASWSGFTEPLGKLLAQWA